MVAVMREPTLLDKPEHRFPLDMGVRIQPIRDLFYAATKNQWDPRVDIPWDQFDKSQYTEEQLWGARHYWSRRAWAEYGAISESPALQIRFCQERREPDLAMFFTIRSQEEARHAEVCYRMAELCGGYIDKPIDFEYTGNVSTHGVRKMALDPDTSLEAVIAALVCGAEEIAFDVFKHLVEITRDPVARAACRGIMRDEVRHCAFGWYFMEHRIPHLSPEEIKKVENAVIVMIEKVELNGYHSSWLAPPGESTDHEVECDRLAWEAGLGSTVEDLEKPIFVGSVQRIRKRMEPWGVHLPTFHHPRIGEI